MIYNSATSIASTHEQLRAIDSSESSVILSKSCTIQPIPGDSCKRRFEYNSNNKTSYNVYRMVNPGIKYYFDFTPRHKPYIISVMLKSVHEFKWLIENIPSHVDGIELNVSCPNYNHLSLDDLSTIQKFPSLTIPIGLKLRPYLLDSEITKTVKQIKIIKPNYIVCCNTIPRGINENGFKGAVGGRALKALSLWNVSRFSDNLSDTQINIVGCGGIFSGQDVFDYFKYGANAVQIGTCSIIEGIECIQRIRKELEVVQTKSHL